MAKSVPPKSLDSALAHVAAGGTLIIPTYTHCTVIDQRVIDRFAKVGAWLLREDGDGYRIRRGKHSDYVVPGLLKYA
ncbi:hypothetical protein LCGC14_1689060 [marine sediment metagenome]|uniref:Uncharacterized protein n=1 Tax=marine sediment metagenome TaxID=412755 RepID=A0A0F9I8X2_9ZZZZ